MDPKLVPSKIIESAPVGPLSSYIEPYIAFISELGFAPRSVYEQVRVIVTFSRSLLRSGCKIRDLNESVTEQFLRDELRDQWPHVAAPATLRRLLTLLRVVGVVPPSKPNAPRNPAQQLTDNYQRFLLEERALSPETINAWVRFIDKFLSELFGAGTLKLSKLRATDVTAFVQRHARCHSPSHARKLVTAMRSFLRYLRYQGLIEIDLDKAVPRVARWSLSDLPKHLPAGAVQRVLDSCDLETSTGRRNYAILLLLARLGLRAGEVVRLKLEDIDWDNALITLCGKGGHRARLPLPMDVGQAIAVYLHRDRPQCPCRSLFIRDRAPLVGFGVAHAISKIVQCALERAGVESARKGAHLLRHSLATDMLRNGASLDEIGEVLRHKSPDSTAIYAKVELDALKPLALRWPGGAQ
ncbi:MAG: site-specific integrase [Chthoniobacterales bacterium]